MKHYYLFRYAPGHWRIGVGKTVHEACKDAFGVVYGPLSSIKYKDMGTRSPKYMTVKAKSAFYNEDMWLDIPPFVERQCNVPRSG
jgi:hypothetical protein